MNTECSLSIIYRCPKGKILTHREGTLLLWQFLPYQYSHNSNVLTRNPPKVTTTVTADRQLIQLDQFSGISHSIHDERD